MKWLKILRWIFAALVLAFILLQFTNPLRKNSPVKNDFIAATAPPPKIEKMFRAACYDCHSDETRWPWYSRIAPVSWKIAEDVSDGRYNLNFSDWPTNNPVRAAKKMEDMSDEIGYGDMPLKKYTFIHRDARLTDSQRKELENWLMSKAAELKTSAVASK